MAPSGSWLACPLAALAAITGIVSYLHALAVVYLTGSAGLGGLPHPVRG